MHIAVVFITEFCGKTDTLKFVFMFNTFGEVLSGF